MNALSIEIFQRYLHFRTATDELCAAFEEGYDCAVRGRSGGFGRFEDLPPERKELTEPAIELLKSRFKAAKDAFVSLSEDHPSSPHKSVRRL